MVPLQRHLIARLVIVSCLATPGTARAQEADHRAMLQEWETRVGRATAESELMPLLDSLFGEAEGRDWALRLLRRGAVERRLGELTGNRRYFDQALEDFWAVATEYRGWPFAWYGLGTTKLAMADQRLLPYPDEHQPEGSTYAREAAVAFDRALEADADFGPARAALDRRTSAVESANPGALLGLAQLRRDGGELDSAIALLNQYLRVGGDSGAGYIELARLLFEAGRPEPGVSAYYRGVAAVRSAESRKRLRDDLAWLMDSIDLQAFDLVPVPRLPSWIEAFWERRDVREARRAGERLAEHYRRLAYAERHFARPSDRLRYTPGQRYRSHQTRLDDRAVIYIRHGAPDDQARFGSGFASAENVAPQIVYNPDDRGGVPRPNDSDPRLPPNLSWKYRRPGGNLVFHFVAHFGTDYKLIESLLDVFSTDTVIKLHMPREAGTPGTISMPAFDQARFTRTLLKSRAELDPVYASLANAYSVQGSTSLQSERAAGQRSLEIGTSTDSYAHSFASSFEMVIQAYGVWRDGRTRMLVVLGVPRDGPATPERLAARLVVSGWDDRRVVQVDTLAVLERGAARADKEYLGTYLELAVPPGRHRLRALLVDSTSNAAGAGTIDSVEAPAPAPGLRLSDVILGVRGGLTWPGPDGPVALNPSGVFARGATVELYYDIDGFTVDSTYRTTIEVRPAAGGERRRISSEFETVSRRTRQAERRQLVLQGLTPGRYLLSVTVTGPGGSVTSRRGLRVR